MNQRQPLRMRVVNCRVGVTWKCIGLERGIQLNECLMTDATTRARGNNDKKTWL